MEPCINLLECVNEKLKKGKVNKIKVAVAYVKLSGVEMFSDLLEDVSECTIITSLDFGITELEGVKKLKELGCSVYIYNGKKEFHPKVYLFESGSQEFAIIGSSNLSEGALTGKNVELNLMVSEKGLIDYINSFINNLISESIPVDDNLLSVLESGGYNDIRHKSYDRPAWDIFRDINRSYYCGKFNELYDFVQKYKERGELMKMRSSIHKMALYGLACDLSSYDLKIDLNERGARGAPDAIIKARNEVKVVVQGMVLLGKTAILSKLSGFDYFIILRMVDRGTREYYILSKSELEKLVRESKIVYNENAKAYEISPRIYEKYRTMLNEFINKISSS